MSITSWKLVNWKELTLAESVLSAVTLTTLISTVVYPLVSSIRWSLAYASAVLPETEATILSTKPPESCCNCIL